jgi:DGQHR domain-containing protein
MLALKVTQKETAFFLVNYKAEDILRKVRFLSRHYREDERDVDGKIRPGTDEIVDFIRGVEKNDGAFQRGLIRRKVKEIFNFYEGAGSQPMIPGPLLLFTPEPLEFQPFRDSPSMGNLTEPSQPFIIIDGQHRLAGLNQYIRKYPEEAGKVEVPAIIFDNRQEDFAAEMFVIINSTHTRINKSHLVDLMEKVTYGTSPEKKWAAWVVKFLYEDSSSPLQYKINKLGGRSRQEKWILQSELYNEIFRLVDPTKKEKGDGSLHRFVADTYGWDRRGGRAPMLFCEYFRAVQKVMGEAWGSKSHLLTSSVSIKALVRVLGEMFTDETVRKEWREQEDFKVFERRIQGWAELIPEFRREGFYERFAAKGQVERVRAIHKAFNKKIDIMGR